MPTDLVFELLVRSGRACDDEHVSNVRLQPTNEIHRRYVIALVEHSGRVRAALHPRRVRQEDDRGVGKQRMVEVVEEFDRHVLHRDDEVEPHAAVFHVQEITKPLPVGRSGNLVTSMNSA